jgi:hypothetical protein
MGWRSERHRQSNDPGLRISGQQDFTEARVLPEKQHRAFGEFYKSARYNTILDSKTTLLIHMAAAMSAACYP